MRTRSLSVPLIALAAALGTAGCDDGAAPAGAASVTVLLTDGPGDVEKAWVDLSEIYLQGGGPEGGPVTLVTGPTGWIELTELAGQTVALAEGVEVPAGSYGQLRFRVVRAALLALDGRVFATTDAGDLPAEIDGSELDGTLHCPSCGQSGLKANMPGGALQAPGGSSTVVVLDLDVDRSFGHEAGSSMRWVMHPVMHVTALEFSGRIEGTVTVEDGVLPIDCGGASNDVTAFLPLATLGAADPASATVAADGTFAFPYLAPGTYDMGFDEISFGDPTPGTLVFTATPDPASAEVTSGGTTVVNYLVTGAECQT